MTLTSEFNLDRVKLNQPTVTDRTQIHEHIGLRR